MWFEERDTLNGEGEVRGVREVRVLSRFPFMSPKNFPVKLANVHTLKNGTM